jgi:hypothetical protein
VAEGERLAVLGKIPDTRLKGGESITVMKVEDGQLTVQRPGQKTTQTLAVGAGVFDGIKIGHGWVESPGRSVSETATVFASVTQRELDNATLNQLAQSGVISGCTRRRMRRARRRSCRGIPPSAWSQSS